MKTLKRNKSCGIDDIPPSYLKDTAVNISKPLAYIINLCLLNGEIPHVFKTAKITPVFKKGNKYELDNYRPISVLPICAKILERCVHSQLMDHLETHKLFSKHQFGFRSKRSTEVAATLFIDSIRRSADEGMMTGAIFIDLSKAFDTLSHSQIISNLSRYGVYDKEKEFFTNYLFNRTQHVSFQNTLSNADAVTCGVPQGSILGPLLFLLSFDGVADVIKDCNIMMYADDTVLFTSAKDHEKIQYKLSADFHRVCDWMEANELIINLKPGKTECMIFGTSQKIKNKVLKVKYRQNEISLTTSYKYLGILLDQSLTHTSFEDFTVQHTLSDSHPA